MKTEHEISIEMRHWPAKKGTRKPTLVISLDALAAILLNESAVIDPDDVAGLLGSLHSYAAKADSSANGALAEWDAVIVEMEVEQEDKDEET